MKTQQKIQVNIAVAFVSLMTFVTLVGLTTATLHAQPGIVRSDSLELICLDTPQILVGYPSSYEVIHEHENGNIETNVTITVREWLKGPKDKKKIELGVQHVNKWDRAALETWIDDQEEFLFFNTTDKKRFYPFDLFPLHRPEKNANFLRMLTPYQTTQRGLLAHTRQAIQSNHQMADAKAGVNATHLRATFFVGDMFERRTPLDSRLPQAIKEYLNLSDDSGKLSQTPSESFIEQMFLPKCREHISDEQLVEILNRIIETESQKPQLPYISRVTEDSVEYQKSSPVVRKAVEALKSLETEVDPTALPDTSTISIKIDNSELPTVRLVNEKHYGDVEYSMRHIPWGNTYVPAPQNNEIPELARPKSIDFHASRLLELGIPDLSALSQVEAVEIKHLSKPIDLSPLTNLPSLKHLDLIGSSPDLDFTPLAELKQLESLCLPNHRITDLSAIESLDKLQRLTLNTNDLSVVSNLTELRALHIYVNNQTDLSPLANLTNLEELSVNGDRFNDLSSLAKLTNLQRLTLGGRNLRALSGLEPLTKLKTLTCWCPNLENLQGLERMEQLEYMHLPGTSVSDLSPLRNLQSLKILNLSGATQLTDISPLQCLTSLEDLDISRTGVADLSPLATAVSLKNIQAEKTPANDVSGLADLENLEYILLGKREKVIGAERLRFIDGLRLFFGLRDHPQYERLKLHRKHLVDHAASVLSPQMLKRLRAVKSKEFVGFNLTATDPNYSKAHTILRRVGAMKMVAVSRADLCSHPELKGLTPDKIHELAKQENDFIAAMVEQHPQDVIGCFAVDPASPFALEETKRCLENERFQFASLNMAPVNDELPIAANSLKPILTACAERKTSVLLRVDLDQVAATVESARSFCNMLVEDPNGLHSIIVPENVSPESLQNLFAAMAKLGATDENAASIRCSVSGAWFDEAQELVEQPDFKNWEPVAQAMRDIGLDRFVIGSGLTNTHAWMFDRVLKEQLQFSFAEVRTIRANSLVQQ